MKRRFRITIWMAFADFFTALALAFFALYVVHSTLYGRTNAEKQQCEDSIRAINNQGLATFVQIRNDSVLLARDLTGRLRQRGVATYFDERSASITLPEDVVKFDSGQAEVKDEFRKKLGVIGETLGEFRKRWQSSFFLLIEGHTDARPISVGSRFKSNLQLSQARAQAVQEVLSDYQVAAPYFQVAAQGRGQYNPKKNNCEGDPTQLRTDCPDQRYLSSLELSDNRRIELRFGILTGKE